MDNSQENPVPESPKILIDRLELPVSNQSLVQRALTHRSYMNENSDALEDNERLEFLGDAVLDYVVGAWLYNRFPEMNEGELTRMRSALVKTDQLANFANEIELGQAIRLGKGEEDNGGRERMAMLCAVFEALIGAISIDAGIADVEAFIAPLLEHAAEVILDGRQDHDPKSMFQEWSQAKGYPAPEYRILSETGPDHAKYFVIEALVGNEVYGEGSGNSKQIASMEAARQALGKLRL